MANFEVDNGKDPKHKLGEAPAGVSDAFPRVEVPGQKPPAIATPKRPVEEKLPKVPKALLEKAKSHKQIIEGIIIANIEKMDHDLVMEGFYQGQATKSTLGGGSAVWQRQLGVIQESIKASKAIIDYLTPKWEELE